MLISQMVEQNNIAQEKEYVKLKQKDQFNHKEKWRNFVLIFYYGSSNWF